MNENMSNASDSAIVRQLTAYLDGELDGEEIRNVENRLASDEKYRVLMQQLQRTWDVLDILPSSTAHSSFTQSTMKLVVEDARKLTVGKTQRYWTWPLRILTLILIPAIASAATYVTSRYYQDIPNRKLINNFAIVQDFDLYSCDENLSIEFLEQLLLEGSIFSGTPNETDREQYGRTPNLIEDVKRDSGALELLTDREKDRIRINNSKFQKLSLANKAKVKAFQTELLNHQQSRQLQTVLRQYYFWLGSLGETDRAIVLDAPNIGDRIAKLKSISEEQFFANFSLQLPISDKKHVYLSLLLILQRRSEEIDYLFSLLFGPEQDLRIDYEILLREYSKSDQEIFSIGRRLQIINNEYPEKIVEIVMPSDVFEIKHTLLSDEAKFEIEKVMIEKAMILQKNNVQSESHLLTNWMLAAFDARFNPVTPKNKQEFYESLPSDVKDSLDNEFPDDRDKRITELLKKHSRNDF